MRAVGPFSITLIVLESAFGVIILATFIILIKNIDYAHQILSGSANAATSHRPVFFTVTILTLAVMLPCIAINSLSCRYFRSLETLNWHAAWLTWSGIFCVFTLANLARYPQGIILFLRNNEQTLHAGLSLLNNFFFLGVGYLLAGLSWRRTMSISLLTSVPLFAASLLLLNIPLRVSFPLPDLLVALGSTYTIVVLGVGFVVFLSKTPPTISGAEKKWNHVTRGAVVATVCVMLLSQLSLPFWRRLPLIEDAFWVLSVGVKLSLMAGFYLTLLVSRYWERVNVDSLIVQRIGIGVIVITGDCRVLRLNTHARTLLNLADRDVEGAHLTGVLFRSLFDADDFYGELREKKRAEERVVMARYHGPEFDPVDEIPLSVAGEAVNQGGSPRSLALVFVRPAPQD